MLIWAGMDSEHFYHLLLQFPLNWCERTQNDLSMKFIWALSSPAETFGEKLFLKHSQPWTAEKFVSLLLSICLSAAPPQKNPQDRLEKWDGVMGSERLPSR